MLKLVKQTEEQAASDNCCEGCFYDKGTYKTCKFNDIGFPPCSGEDGMTYGMIYVEDEG